MLLLLGLSVNNELLASEEEEGKDKVIQFSGLVVTGDSSYGVPGVHIYVPSVGRGTTSNEVGFFTMPALVGDSILISAVSFKKRYYVVPDIKGDHITAYIELFQDTIKLPELQVYPWPTEDLFKEAFLAMSPTTGEEMLKRGQLNENLLLRMRYTMPMDYRMTYYQYMDDYSYRQANEYMGQTTGFVDPFAWRRFIKGLKKKN